MPFGDGIERKFCFSLSDFHDFDYCVFRYLVNHDLGKKYELAEGSPALALGSLLDVSIKLFHKSRAYGLPVDYMPNIVKAAVLEIKRSAAKSKGPSFYSPVVPFLDEGLAKKAGEVFKDYYRKKGGEISRSLGEVGFCEHIIETGSNRFKLWGGPDTYEMSEDGVPEVVDYKSRQDIEGAKGRIDMDLMPKIYMLLASKFLKSKGYDTARFRVRFWQDPLEEGFYEQFQITDMRREELFFRARIEKILGTRQVTFCQKDFCNVCKSDRKQEFLGLLDARGFSY